MTVMSDEPVESVEAAQLRLPTRPECPSRLRNLSLAVTSHTCVAPQLVPIAR